MIKAIIIDDEVHCVDTLSILLDDFCPEVEVIEKCMSAKKGLEAIERLQPERQPGHARPAEAAQVLPVHRVGIRLRRDLGVGHDSEGTA